MMKRRSMQPPRRQQGIVLFITLIVLVAMTLAAVALIRSVDTGTQIAGNLAFKQGATISADAGVEAARTWLLANGGTATVNNDSPTNGYYATSQDSLDILGTATPGNTSDDVDWNASGNAAYADQAKTITADAAGNQIAYVINRLCTQALGVNDPNNSCRTFQQTSSSGSTMSGGAYGGGALSGTLQTYYKVTVRVAGPRNTMSFVQVVLLI